GAQIDSPDGVVVRIYNPELTSIVYRNTPRVSECSGCALAVCAARTSGSCQRVDSAGRSGTDSSDHVVGGVADVQAAFIVVDGEECRVVELRIEAGTGLQSMYSPHSCIDRWCLRQALSEQNSLLI